MNNEELRKKFNPDGSLLRRQQMRMLELLLEVDRICKKHDIPYWLSGGTLLGAVRHQGFIPWDDDLDIEMLKKDYNRLMKVLPAELPETMALQHPDNDKNYIFWFAKIRDRRSFMSELNHYDRVFKEQGIYIDIFPLRKQPMWVHKLSELSHGHVYKIMNRMGKDNKEMWKVRFIKRFNKYVVHPILSLCCWIGKPVLQNDFGIPNAPMRELKDIFPLSELEFEGHKVPVPDNVDHVLTLQYGDYMTVPDIKEVNLHVEKLTIDD